MAKANEKMIVSIFAAAEYKKKGQFLTLTYSDDSLPNGLNHADFAGFMKRLRRLDGTPDVKFHVAGEYGEKSGREHFHVLIYNYHYDIELVKRAWNMGFVYDGTLTPKSMKYVSGYVCKKGYDPGSGKRAPYGRTSINLPDGLSTQEIVDMCMSGRVQYNGRKFSVPKNWRRRYNFLWHDCINHRVEARESEPIRDVLTPKTISAMMDERERKFALKRRKRI